MQYQMQHIIPWKRNALINVCWSQGNPVQEKLVIKKKTFPMFQSIEFVFYTDNYTNNVIDVIFHLRILCFRQCALIVHPVLLGKFNHSYPSIYHCNFAEASKKILQYLAAISPYSTEVERVKEKLLKSNPLLEVLFCTYCRIEWKTFRLSKTYIFCILYMYI